MKIVTIICGLILGSIITEQASNLALEQIKAQNRRFIQCMNDMEAGGEEVRLSIDSCVIQLHYGEQ